MVGVRIGGIVVSMLAFSVVDRRFEPIRSCHTNDYNIGIYYFSAKLTCINIDYGIRLLCMSRASCLPGDCCFSELAPEQLN